MAAASVLLTHTGLRMLVPVAAMPAFSWPHAAYAFVAGFDHQAVMVFFVISGLLVGGSVVHEIRATGAVAIIPYLGRRLTRLWVVLWPAFALGAACTSGAIALGAIPRGIVAADDSAALSLPTLLCNAAFLQTAACPQFAGNGALWSLFNEFWYYVLFPPLALALLAPLPVGRRMLFAGTAGLALAGLTAAQFTGSPIGPYMLVWAVGVAAAGLPRAVVSAPWLAATLWLGASLAVRLFVRRSFAGAHPLLSAELDLVLALLFGNLLLTLRHCPALRPPPWPRLQARLAGFSFSLYCIHIPILSLYIAVLTATTGYGWQMSGTGALPWLAIGGGLAVCTGTAWMFAGLTEAHTVQLRRWLARFRPLPRWAAR